MCCCEDPCEHNARCLRLDACRRCLGGDTDAGCWLDGSSEDAADEPTDLGRDEE